MNRFYKKFLSFLTASSFIFSGTEDGSSATHVVTVGSNLVAGYLNENVTYLRIYFTPDEDFTQLSVFAESTGSSSNIGGCTESQFNGTALTLSTFDGSATSGTVYAPGGNISQAQHYVDVSMDNLIARLSDSNWDDAEGRRVYIAVKLGTNNDNWACPTTALSDGDATNNGQSDGTYRYHIIDRTDPTFSSVTDGGDQNLNGGSSTTGNINNYTNSNVFKITTGSEAVSNIKVTWTKDDGDGSSISDGFQRTKSSGFFLFSLTSILDPATNSSNFLFDN